MANGNRLTEELRRLTDPQFQEQEISRRIDLGQPQLQRLLRQLTSRLNTQGLFSAAPVTRATSRATSEFAGDISRGFFEDIEERRFGLIELIEKIEQAERERKSRDRSSLFGGIGGLIGTGLSFIPGFGGGSEIDRLIQLLSGQDGGGGGFEFSGDIEV